MKGWFRDNKGIIVLIVIVIAIVFISSKTKQMPVTVSDWQLSFKTRTEQIPKEYLESTYIYDYDNENIKMISEQLVKESSNAMEYTENVLEYVYQNVRYDFTENDQTCFDSRASTVLERGSGQCDTQSMAVVALLRAGGIPAYSIGGCIHKAQSLTCDMQYALTEMREPIFRPLIETVFSRGTDPIYTELPTYFSRGVTGRTGGLHAWVRAFTGERFQLLESTSGQIIESSCYIYTDELEVTNVHELCVSSDMLFALWCSKQ